MELVIGIDIGGTNTVFGLIDRFGRQIAGGRLNTKDFDSPLLLAKELYQHNKVLLKNLDFKPLLQGIGIGVPNGNYYKGTVEFAPNLNWEGEQNLQEIFSGIFNQLPVHITNDANAAAIGEMTYGAARGMRDFIMITLGTGVGSGLVANGNVIYGHDGFAGELGHTTVIVDGRKCACGRRGCFEAYVSATGVRTTVIEFLEKSKEKSNLRDLAPENISAKEVHLAALDNDPVALETFDFTGKILGIKLAEAVAYTSPEAIFLFGGLAKAGEFIFGPAKKYMEENLFSIYRGKVKILPSEIKDVNAAVLGASALAWQNHK